MEDISEKDISEKDINTTFSLIGCELPFNILTRYFRVNYVSFTNKLKIFKNLCMCGHIKSVKWLYNILLRYPYGRGRLISCVTYGVLIRQLIFTEKLHILMWIYDLDILDKKNKKSFIELCVVFSEICEKINIARWICRVNTKYSIIKTEKSFVIKKIHLYDTIKKNLETDNISEVVKLLKIKIDGTIETDKCQICGNEKNIVQLPCKGKHCICLGCICESYLSKKFPKICFACTLPIELCESKIKN
jgi:hypothetical protein